MGPRFQRTLTLEHYDEINVHLTCVKTLRYSKIPTVTFDTTNESQRPTLICMVSHFFNLLCYYDKVYHKQELRFFV